MTAPRFYTIVFIYKKIFSLNIFHDLLYIFMRTFLVFFIKIATVGFTSTTSGSSGQSSSSTTGTSAPSTAPKKSFTCVDCHKTVSTSRNLQRHRMSCKLAQASSNPGKSMTSGQLQATVITVPLNSTQVGFP